MGIASVMKASTEAYFVHTFIAGANCKRTSILSNLMDPTNYWQTGRPRVIITFGNPMMGLNSPWVDQKKMTKTCQMKVMT
eukprot:11519619-Ditylum_brightwellii.AAC.1